jgi:hypothetical protein
MFDRGKWRTYGLLRVPLSESHRTFKRPEQRAELRLSKYKSQNNFHNVLIVKQPLNKINNDHIYM